MDRKTSISFRYKGSIDNLEKQLKQVISAALDRDIYTKYIVDRYVYSWKGRASSTKITVDIVYRETKAESAYVSQRAKQIVREIINKDMNDHEKIKVIHDYVVQHLKYDYRLQRFTAYEGLKIGEVVCQGYTLLTYKLLEEAGFKSKIVEGKAKGQLHAWNLVKLDGQWYHMDTTWDDPGDDKLFKGGVKYTYYLKTDKQLSVDHTWNTKKYPITGKIYRDVVLEQINAGHADKFKAILEDLGFHLYESNAAVRNSNQLVSKISDQMKLNKKIGIIRYEGSESDLIDDLASLYTLDIKKISYFLEKLEDTDDWKVEIRWE
ncbi:Transglutaminase-like superfamily protein [compost metagenome]